MRKKPPGKLSKTAHKVEREYRIIHALERRMSGSERLLSLRGRQRDWHALLHHGVPRRPNH
jgi:aminoglycoside phosphotransferase (APT) family kinase protein